MRLSNTNSPISTDVLGSVINFLETGKRKEAKAPNFLCEAFCLYSGIMAMNLNENDFDFYIDTTIRKADIGQNLRSKNKYKSLTSEELDEKIKANNLKDIRNSFFHGNFEVLQEEGLSWFVLKPERAHNITNHPLLISFEEIYKVLGDKFNQQQKEYLSKKIKTEEEKSQYTQKLFTLPFVEMAQYFRNENFNEFQTKDFILKSRAYLYQYLLTVDNSYQQNELMPFLKNPSQKEQLCVLRNSTAHARIIFGKNKLKYVDINEKTGAAREMQLSPKELRKVVIHIQANALTEYLEEFLTDLENLEKSRNDEETKKFVQTARNGIIEMKKNIEIIKKNTPLESAQEKED